MRSPLWPSSVTGTVVPASPRRMAAERLRRLGAPGGDAGPPAGRATPASGRGTSGGGRSSPRGSRERAGRAWRRPPGGPIVRRGAGRREERRIRALYRGFTPGAVDSLSCFDRESDGGPSPREAFPPRTGPGLVSEDPRDRSRLSPSPPRGGQPSPSACGGGGDAAGRGRSARPSGSGRSGGRPGRRLPDQVPRPDRGAGHGPGHGPGGGRRDRRALPRGRPGGPGHGAPADRPRPLPAGGGARAGHARAVAGGAGPGRGRPEAPRGAGPERPPLGRGAEPLALRSTRLTASVEVAKAALGIAQQNLARSEVRPRSRASSTPGRWTPASSSRWAPCWRRSWTSSRLRLRFKVSEAESLRAT